MMCTPSLKAYAIPITTPVESRTGLPPNPCRTVNVMMASGGYPWTVIPVENRTAYMQALEKTSVG
jgi:hypothetical protein